MNDLISRKEAIEALLNHYEVRNPFVGQNTTIDECVDLLNKIPTVNSDLSDYSDRLWKSAFDRGCQKGYEEAVRHYAKMALKQWTPVGERLPDEEPKHYWVCTDDGTQHECRWTNANAFWTGLTTDWHWNIFDIPQYTKVVAWMPLPPAYREEGGHNG